MKMTDEWHAANCPCGYVDTCSGHEWLGYVHSFNYGPDRTFFGKSCEEVFALVEGRDLSGTMGLRDRLLDIVAYSQMDASGGKWMFGIGDVGRAVHYRCAIRELSGQVHALEKELGR